MNWQDEQAAVTTVAQTQKTVGKVFNSTLVPKAYLLVDRIPACPSCGGANPRGLTACPDCGAPAPERTDFRDVDAVLTEKLVPIHARVLLWIGQALTRLADRITRS